MRETLMLKIIDTYYQPNRTVHDLHDLVENGGPGVDPLRAFSEAARDELVAFAAG